MFSRIYTGIVLSLLIASLLSYAVYLWSYNTRYPQHESRSLSGVVSLVASKIQAQSPATRERYLRIVSDLLDASAETVAVESLADGARGPLRRGEPHRLDVTTDAMVWCLPVDARECVELSVSPLSELHFRAMAILYVAEMSRRSAPATVESLQALSPFALAVLPLEAVEADAQQRSRLDNGAVTLIPSAADPNSFGVFAPIDGASVLHIGPIERFDRFPVSLVVGLLATAGGVVGVACYLLVAQLERQLHRMSSTMARFGEGALDARVAHSGDDAVARVGKQFNTMATNIKRVVDGERSFIGAVSHDLRTPLARMRFRLEDIEHPVSEAERGAALVGLRSDLDDVQGYIDELLEHHRLGSAQAAVFGDTVVDSVVRDTVDAMRTQYAGVQIDTELNAESAFHLDKRLFQRIVTNLIDNACKYGKGVVRITTAVSELGLTLCVADNGAGVPPAERGRVFDVFYQAEGSRGSTRSGYGLGLSIVKRVIALHDGDIDIGDSELGGACFCVHLPRRVDKREARIAQRESARV
ncbi:MAG: ATP-binding protein [Pseudomonadota bacterium]